MGYKKFSHEIEENVLSILDKLHYRQKNNYFHDILIQKLKN